MGQKKNCRKNRLLLCIDKDLFWFLLWYRARVRTTGIVTTEFVERGRPYRWERRRFSPKFLPKKNFFKICFCVLFCQYYWCWRTAQWKKEMDSLFRWRWICIVCSTLLINCVCCCCLATLLVECVWKFHSFFHFLVCLCS